jgi:hypothetical protein
VGVKIMWMEGVGVKEVWIKEVRIKGGRGQGYIGERGRS